MTSRASSSTASTAATTLAADPSRLWPYDGSCSADALRPTGWSPSPFREFIVKVQSRCNLNCDYCYVYNLGDESWRLQPRQVSATTTEAIAASIREHALGHGFDSVLISLHGGEPLLRGIEPVRDFVTTVRDALHPVGVQFSMQTNATLVTRPVAEELRSLDIGVGASIDGTASASDRHRLSPSGRSSFARTRAGIEHLAAVPGLLQGLLCVIDVHNDPVETYEFLAGLGAPSIDFLLPHGHWDERPTGKSLSTPDGPGSEAPYADWLIAAYEAWAADSPKRVRVRIFEDIVHLCLGGQHTYEGLGVHPAQLLVIEANGDIELVDHLKSSYDGATRTGLSVLDHSLDTALEHPGVVCRQLGLDGLSAVCQQCPAARICGAGLISHRYSSATGFRSPTVYCSDMFKLIGHIRDDLAVRARHVLDARAA